MIPIIARARVTRAFTLPRGFQKSASFNFFGQGQNILDSEIFEAVSENYAVSPDPKDYLFLVARAVTANVPNSNGDRFPLEELRRFNLQSSCQVYQTFQNKPIHVNHVAENPKLARGFIPDVHLNRNNPDDIFVETLVALDRTKAPHDKLVADYEAGRRKAFSMGCLAGRVQCSICNKIASTEHDMCRHLRGQKMQKIGGRLCYEDCFDVTYSELSCVDDPADKTAVTQALLGKLEASRRAPVGTAYAAFRMAASASSGSRVIDTLDLTAEEKRNITQYLRANINEMPDGMVRLSGELMKGLS